jgi:hypothetical protein
MKSSLRLAGAAALCAALLLSACAKKTTDQTTTSTDSTQGTTTASSAPDATASASPDASATTAAAPSTPAAESTTTVTTSTSNGTASGGGGYIDLPVYPGATENKDNAMQMSTNGGSFTVKIYTSKDDTKKVADWYKSHLPAAFKGGVLTAGDKTVGTFADEHPDGDQSIVVASQDDHTTRIQLSTKHGK